MLHVFFIAKVLLLIINTESEVGIFLFFDQLLKYDAAEPSSSQIWCQNAKMIYMDKKWVSMHQKKWQQK